MFGRSLCSLSYNLRQWINRWSALALALLVGYAGVVYLAAHPNVSEAYRAYYIDRSSGISPASLEKLKDPLPALTLERTYAHDAPEIMLIGWSSAEAALTWTHSKRAQIRLFLPTEETGSVRNLTLVLQGTYLHGQQRIITSVGPGRIDQTYRDGEDIVIPLRLAPGAEPNVIVTLELPDAALPGNGDSRMLGFALRTLRVSQTAL